VDQILKIAPGRIVYVSCNPATQARDVEMMNRAYQLEENTTCGHVPTYPSCGEHCTDLN